MRGVARLAALLAIPMTTAMAQGMGAHVSWADLGVPEFAKPLGYGIVIEQPVGQTAVHWQFGFDAGFGRHTFTGTPCSGLVDPNSQLCATQSLHESLNMQAAAFGLRVPVLRGKRAALSLLGDLGIQRIGTKTKNATGDAVRSAWRMMYRPEVGAEARVAPSANRGFWLTAGYAVGQVRPFTQQGIADGYAPFENPLDIKRAWLGVIVAIDPTAGRRR